MVFALLIGAGFSLSAGGAPAQPELADSNDNPKLTVHKSPTCGCCGVWALYMGRRGYSTDIQETLELSDLKADLGVPAELASCHTSKIGGYVVEGHIPNEAVEKLLTERPDIKGIGLAGMPAGSPGMPGPKTEDFVIYEITKDGEVGEVFMII